MTAQPDDEEAPLPGHRAHADFGIIAADGVVRL